MYSDYMVNLPVNCKLYKKKPFKMGGFSYAGFSQAAACFVTTNGGSIPSAGIERNNKHV